MLQNQNNALHIIRQTEATVSTMLTQYDRLLQKRYAWKTQAENMNPDQWEKSSSSSTHYFLLVLFLLIEVLKVF